MGIKDIRSETSNANQNVTCTSSAYAEIATDPNSEIRQQSDESDVSVTSNVTAVPKNNTEMDCKTQKSQPDSNNYNFWQTLLIIGFFAL